MKKKNIKIKLNRKKILLPLNKSQGGIRICDKSGNHVIRPTETENKIGYFVEWMITNDEIKFLVDSFFDRKSTKKLIKKMNNIKKFIDESKYSKRETIKLKKEQVETFEGFEIFQYTEKFSSFEKQLSSGIRVRVTFKLGDYGLEPHPHMYVLIPFNHKFLELKNLNGKVKEKEILGKGCFSEWLPRNKDIKEITVALVHASSNHRNALVRAIKS